MPRLPNAVSSARLRFPVIQPNRVRATRQESSSPSSKLRIVARFSSAVTTEPSAETRSARRNAISVASATNDPQSLRFGWCLRPDDARKRHRAAEFG
ncbi:hypothetical protein GCM10009754_54560 [Amycolatopsis minnesotensis]|uniref:Uncharacterized protein n=1 Tax=Amycolatopsis minnesotensis TaxID=337894 RepID=A0ABP5D411_9PSEU